MERATTVERPRMRRNGVPCDPSNESDRKTKTRREESAATKQKTKNGKRTPKDDGQTQKRHIASLEKDVFFLLLEDAKRRNKQEEPNEVGQSLGLKQERETTRKTRCLYVVQRKRTCACFFPSLALLACQENRNTCDLATSVSSSPLLFASPDAVAVANTGDGNDRGSDVGVVDAGTAATVAQPRV